MNKAGIIPTVASPKLVNVANGQSLVSDKQVTDLNWWTQGYTFASTMRVLDLPAYDAIIGYDWLKSQSPILHDWDNRTMQFQFKGESIILKGVQPAPLTLAEISWETVYKWLVGNEVWALAVVDAHQDQSVEDDTASVV